MHLPGSCSEFPNYSKNNNNKKNNNSNSNSNNRNTSNHSSNAPYSRTSAFENDFDYFEEFSFARLSVCPLPLRKGDQKEPLLKRNPKTPRRSIHILDSEKSEQAVSPHLLLEEILELLRA